MKASSIMSFFKKETINTPKVVGMETINTPQVVGMEEPNITGKKVGNESILLVEKRGENHDLCDRILNAQTPGGHSPLAKDAVHEMPRMVSIEQCDIDKTLDNTDKNEVVENNAMEVSAVETPVVETPVVETPAADDALVEAPAADDALVEAPVVETASSRPSRKKKAVDSADATVKTPRARAPRAASTKKKNSKDNTADDNSNESTEASVDAPQAPSAVDVSAVDVSAVVGTHSLTHSLSHLTTYSLTHPRCSKCS